MTIKEQKRQIIIQQCMILDSDLTEEEKQECLKPLFEEFRKLKKQETKEIATPGEMAIRLTNLKNGNVHFFKRNDDVSEFLKMPKSTFASHLKKGNVIKDYLYERRLKKYRYKKDDLIIIGTASEIEEKTGMSSENIASRANEVTGRRSKILIKEIDRWEVE